MKAGTHRILRTPENMLLRCPRLFPIALILEIARFHFERPPRFVASNFEEGPAILTVAADVRIVANLAPIEKAGVWSVPVDEIVAVPGIEGPVAAIHAQTVYGVLATFFVLHDNALGGEVLLEFAPGRVRDAATGIARAPAVDEEVLMRVEYEALPAGAALEGLDDTAFRHPAKQAQPREEGLAPRGL